MWKNVVAPTLLVILFWGLSSIATAYYIRWLEKVPERMILEDLTTIHAADSMRFTLGVLFRTVVGAQHPITGNTAAQVAKLQEEFRKHLDEAIRSATTPDELEIDHQIEAKFREFCEEIDRQAKETPAQADTGENVKRLIGITGEISALGIRLADLNEKFMKELATSRSPSARSLTLIRYGLLIIGPAAGILCGFWISRGFHRSISRISITLNDVASEMQEQVGRVEVRESAELPGLQEQVDSVVARIREVMQQLNAARRQAISAERLAALGEMAAGVAHELRNPLTSVKLLIQRSAQRPERALTDKQLGVVLEEIGRMETTIERMLDFARPPRMSRTRHDICSMLSTSLQLIEARANQANVAIVTDIHSCPLEIDGDGEQLHQVFGNLAQNAIEAMPGGGTLRVKIECENDKSICRVIFADTGEGISHDVMPRLFEPFVTNKARGTGLGLAVSNRIVKEHGGTIVAKNSPHGGAIFTIELPLVKPPAIPVKPSSTPTPVITSSAPNLDVESTNAQVAHH